MIADYREFDQQVLRHITRYPGLTAYEIARALGKLSPEQRVNANGTNSALHRLLLAGKVRSRYIDAPVPGGRKCTWEGVRNDARPDHR